MNQPLRTCIRRAGALALVALGFAFLTPAGASANTPVKIVAQPVSTLDIWDDEFWGPMDHYQWSLSGTTFGSLGAGSSNFSYKLARCVGGEVRGELMVDGFRWANDETAWVTARVDLYEGTSCQSPDLDGSSELVTFSLKPGYAKKVKIVVENYKEDGGDTVIADVWFKALPV